MTSEAGILKAARSWFLPVLLFAWAGRARTSSRIPKKSECSQQLYGWAQAPIGSRLCCPNHTMWCPNLPQPKSLTKWRPNQPHTVPCCLNHPPGRGRWLGYKLDSQLAPDKVALITHQVAHQLVPDNVAQITHQVAPQYIVYTLQFPKSAAKLQQ